MIKLANLLSNLGTWTTVGYDFNNSLRVLAENGEVDTYIIPSDLDCYHISEAMTFFSEDLNIEQQEIRDLADWNRTENHEISLIGLPSRNNKGRLRGIILAACETAECYKQFAPPLYSKPYRDFYYNVAYESIVYASKKLNANKLAMSHLSGCCHFHENIATCVAEALAHFCDIEQDQQIESFMYVGGCVWRSHLEGIENLNREGRITRHRNIRTWNTTRNGFDVVSMDWR